MSSTGLDAGGDDAFSVQSPPVSAFARATGRTREEIIIESALDAIVTIAADNKIIEWNPAAEAILGWTRAEAMGQSLGELIIPERFRAAHYQGMALLAAEGIGAILKQRLELPALRKDGEEILVELMVTDIRTEDAVVYTGFMRDVTKSRRASEALEAARVEAEKAREEAEKARREAEKAREEAINANRSKGDFLSRMSHELRTPLNAILGFGQLLQVAPMPPNARQNVDQILKGGRHLLDLINEILDTARIDSGQLSLSLEPISAAEVRTEVLDLIRPLAYQHGIMLMDEPRLPESSEDAPWVYADLQRLRQILLNLLSNSVKYNRSNGRVWLEYEAVGADHVQFSVRDTGPGIPASMMDRLFVPFERLGAEASAVEGTGIGLSLSQKLAEAMDGTLVAASVEGEGTTFTLTLPVAKDTSQRVDRSEKLPKAGPMSPVKWHVLYIEDHESNLQLMQGVFSLRPELRLLTATTGPDGLRMAREYRPDLILLDLHLPGMTGQEVLQEIKIDPNMQQVPVVIVSADAGAKNQADLLSRGAVAFVTKPLDIGALLEALHQNLPLD